jgi:hypothetical protein
MTFEGRKAYHEQMIKLGRESPYADEFSKDDKVVVKAKKVDENPQKSKSKGVKE